MRILIDRATIGAALRLEVLPADSAFQIGECDRAQRVLQFGAGQIGERRSQFAAVAFQVELEIEPQTAGVVAVACLPIFFTGNVIARWEGGLFFAYYIAYTTYLVLAATQATITRTLARS